MGELPFLGLPAILVPYPYAWRYQKVNAQYLADRDAAVIVEDAKLLDELLPIVGRLLNSRSELDAMRRALLNMGGRDGAKEIAQLLFNVGQQAQVMA